MERQSLIKVIFSQQSSDVQAVVSLYGISDLLSIGEGYSDEIQKVHESPAVTEALLVNGCRFQHFFPECLFQK